MGVTGAPARFLAGRRILTIENPGKQSETTSFSDELTVSSSDSVFGFLEPGSVESTGSSSDEIDHRREDEDEEDEERENSGNSLEENKSFWQNLLNSLQATLYRTTTLETGIRRATRDAMKETEEQGNYCKCRKMGTGNNCRNCWITEVCRKLRNAGYNCSICKSKWRSTAEIPAGEHTYLDVIDDSNPKKGEVRVIIELNFRAEFEMARASEEYNQLISQLPEVFVGKVERLRALVKILCSAAKKCMKDKKMHMAPWRKQKYMQAKWFNTCERIDANAHLDWKISDQTSKRPIRASMLTMALMNVPCKAVEVV